MKKFWQTFKNLRLWRVLGGCFRRFFGFLGRHLKATLLISACLVLLVGGAIALGLTLPVKSVEIEGEVILLQGEAYTGGLSVKATTGAGLVHREDVLPDMIEGYDPTLLGEQTVTVAYGKRNVSAKITVIARSDVTLRVREGSMPQEYEPSAPFPTSGVFELYYNNALLRTRPILSADAPGFTTRLSGEYDITLYYLEGWGVPYHYSVPVIIESIEAEGVLLLPQGAALSKSDIVGNVRFLVKYKDGTERYVSVADDLVDMPASVLAADPDGKDYESNVSFFYMGYEVSSPVTAYYGELFAPKSVTLQSDKTVYLQGEEFDYSSARLEVVFERFGGAPITVQATQKMVFLAEWQGDPSSENRYLVPISDGNSPIVCEEAGYLTLVAYYHSVASSPLRVRVVTQEDAWRITGLSTTWRGTQSGPPQKGEELDFTDATVTVEYGFGYRYETVPMVSPSVTVTGYDKGVAGTQMLTLAYTRYDEDPEVVLDRYETGLAISVLDSTSDAVTAIVGVIGWDEKMGYTADELVVPDTAQLEVEIGYGGKPNKKVPIKGNDAVTVTGYRPHVLGTQELTFTYAGKEVKYVITVLDDREKTIVDFWAPEDIYIGIGDPLDTSGECTVFYSKGDPLTLSLAEVLDAGGTMEGTYYDATVAGDYAVRFYYPGFDSSDHFTWIHVSGDASPQPKGIRLDLSEAKVAYKIGEELNVNGMKLYLYYSDGNEELVVEQLTPGMFDVKSFDTTTPTKPGEKNRIVVVYVSGSDTYKTYYEYTVEE